MHPVTYLTWKSQGRGSFHLTYLILFKQTKQNLTLQTVGNQNEGRYSLLDCSKLSRTADTRLVENS